MVSSPAELATIAQRAVELVSEGNVLGLGTGHAATAFLQVLGERVKAGLTVRGVPTSEASAKFATQLGIPLTTFDEVDHLDWDFDGADEVDPAGNLIKGLGGALVREKIVAAASRKVVILVGTEKLVPKLGSHGILPVEVLPFALAVCQRAIAHLGLPSKVRLAGTKPFVSDNGNLILDCHVKPIDDPVGLDQQLRDIPGVVGTGLFLNMNPTVLVPPS